MGRLLERAASPDVLNAAWRAVRADKSRWSPELTMEEMERDLPLHIGRIAAELLSGRFRPLPMRCFELTKADGGKRRICAPSVRDKLAQRAVLTVLEPLGEAVFHPASFGYRPLCTVDMAVSRVREMVRMGESWLGDADIAKCFDNIPHDGVLGYLAGLCEDPELVELVRLWLLSMPVAPGGQPGLGLAQGSVLSPFLCNLYLHDMDMDFEEHGIRFVRYADDFIVFGRTRTEAEQALRVATASLKRLGLRLNLEKTQVVESSKAVRFLGKALPNPVARIAG